MNFVQTAPIQEISVEGFQVVSGSMFAHLPRHLSATCTLWPDSINFSKYAIYMLNNCERIRIEVNTAKRCILVVPVTANDRDGVRWMKTKNQEIEARKMDCKQFTGPLYDAWGWDREYVYRATGQLVTYDQKVMLLFDFSYPENWKGRGLDKSNG